MPAKRILVVDDNESVLESMGMLVTDIGHVAEMAGNGLDALRRLEVAEFDLVLTDSKMPGMSGRELAEEIKKRRPTLPIVIFTGSPLPRLSPHAARLLQKPFSMDQLRITIETLT